MSDPHVQTIPVPATRHLLRLRLKPKAPATGFVDGGWWPRSRNLAAELPALAEVLAVRLGQVSRVAYALTGWDAAPRRAEVDGHLVRLEGFRSQEGNIVHVTGTGRQRISLLVVPPEANAATGHAAMMTAAGRDNTDSPAKILTASGFRSGTPIPRPRVAADDAEDRWEGDGGHV
jgi:hypothetical protein